MACDNSSTKNDQSNKPQKIPSNIHFDDVLEKLLEQEHNNAATW